MSGPCGLGEGNLCPHARTDTHLLGLRHMTQARSIRTFEPQTTEAKHASLTITPLGQPLITYFCFAMQIAISNIMPSSNLLKYFYF